MCVCVSTIWGASSHAPLSLCANTAESELRALRLQASTSAAQAGEGAGAEDAADMDMDDGADMEMEDEAFTSTKVQMLAHLLAHLQAHLLAQKYEGTILTLSPLRGRASARPRMLSLR